MHRWAYYYQYAQMNTIGWVRLDLIFMMRDIYTSIPTKIVPISMRIVISFAMKRDILFWVCWEVNGNWKTTTQWKFSVGRKTTVEQILLSEEINKSKRTGMCEWQSWVQVGKSTIWVRSLDIKKFTSSIPKNKLTSMMAVKIFKDKCIILDKITSKTVQKDKWDDWWQKKKYEGSQKHK